MYPYFLLINLKDYYGIYKRKKGENYIKYNWIKNLKNKHLGKRCFIVATGPSLTLKDLDSIKNEISFSMNSSILSFDKTDWRPTYYGVQDEYVYEKLKEKIDKEKNNLDIWISENIAKKFKKNNFKIFPLHYLDHKMFHMHGYGKFKFSDDCYSCIYDGYSIIFSLMQIACYMGFKEIYLLGCDCNYNQEKSHFIEYGHKDPKKNIMGDKIISAHKAFNEFAKKENIKIINCTRGGMLEVYERKNLEDVLNI